MMNVLPYESVVHIHAFFHAHASDRGLTSVGYSKGVELGHRRIFSYILHLQTDVAMHHPVSLLRLHG